MRRMLRTLRPPRDRRASHGRRTPRIPLVALAGCAAGLAGLGWLAAQPPAGEPGEPPRATVAPGPAGFYVGTASCAGDSCHGATRPRDVYPVLQNEYYTWLNQDPHADARQVLSSRRSEIIARNLGLGEPAAASAACLSCHGLSVPASRVAGRLEPDAGVTCESCHGPASGWRDAHTEEGWTHADSLAAGMVDMADVRTRAGVCLECHAGARDKRVNHDLLAAGHPPLDFELDNFTRSMPPHWRPWRARPADSRPTRPNHGARAWAVGQAKAFQAGLERIARDARSGPWPDFTHLSCTACHHSLAEERWARGGAGRSPYQERIGMPPWSPAHWEVLEPVVARVAPGEREALARGVARLARQLSSLATPRLEVAGTADELAARMARVVPAVDAASWDEPEVRALLGDLVGDRRELAAADLATAEQALYATWALVGDLVDREPARAGGDLVAAILDLERELEAGELDRDRFAALLERLDAEAEP